MSTVLIIVIVVVVVLVILVGLLVARLPQARERARIRKREGELEQRREQRVDEHRDEAARREREAEVAEQRARVAAQEAERQRAESRLAEEKAKLHERGLADHDLIDEDERARFAGTSAAPRPDETAGDDPAVEGSGGELSSRTTTYEQGRAAAQDPARAQDLETGRRHEERP